MNAKFIVAVVLMAACTRNPDATVQRGAVGAAVPADVNRVAAADELTRQYSGSHLSEWQVRAAAAGSDCKVLSVETPVIMEETMVEAMHYGAGAYHVRDGGIEKYYRDHQFRGVTYKDGSGHRWRFGHVSDGETLAPCR